VLPSTGEITCAQKLLCYEKHDQHHVHVLCQEIIRMLTQPAVFVRSSRDCLWQHGHDVSDYELCTHPCANSPPFEKAKK
jgi:hypothetical protein